MTDRSPSAPLLIGHRGAPGYRPEHTASAYRLAFEQGVDAVEPDIVVSSDGVLVIRHENEISGTTDVADHPEFASRRTTKTVDGEKLTGWFVEDFTWAELSTLRCRERVPELRPLNAGFDGQEQILRLEDLFSLVAEGAEKRGRDIALVIEIKHAHFLLTQGHDIGSLLLDALAQSGWHQKPELLTVECFELGVLERLRDAGLLAKFVFLMESEGGPADEVAVLGSRARTYDWYRSDEGLDSLAGRVHGISLAKRDLLRYNSRGKAVGVHNIVQRAHAHGLTVFTWTMRPENIFLAPGYRASRKRAEWGDWQGEWRLILSTGLDGVFLDHPDLLAEVL